MSVKVKHAQTGTTYFCTFTNYIWLHLFEITNFYDRLYKWFDFLTKNNNKILGYAIMPNHIHLLIYLPEGALTIDKVIGEGKRFMAYQIVTLLKKQNRNDILEVLQKGVTISAKKNNVKHKVFQDSFDCKECYSSEFIQQKLNYMHLNPVHDKWKLAEMPEDYLHSSAQFYITGIQGRYLVTHYLEYYDVPIAK